MRQPAGEGDRVSRWCPSLPPGLPRLPTGLLFEGELVCEAGEPAKRFGPPRLSLAARHLLPISAHHLQLDGHQHPARALLPSAPHPLCFSDYGLLPGLRRRLARGLEQPADEPAPAPPRILFLILA